MKKAPESIDSEPLYDPQYPARQVLRVIADTWTPIVLFCLKRGTRRFNELQRSIPDISRKMLTQTLRKLERRGLLDRLVHPVVPPHVDYTLDTSGHEVRGGCGTPLRVGTEKSGNFETSQFQSLR